MVREFTQMGWTRYPKIKNLCMVLDMRKGRSDRNIAREQDYWTVRTF